MITMFSKMSCFLVFIRTAIMIASPHKNTMYSQKHNFSTYILAATMIAALTKCLNFQLIERL